MSNNQPSDEHRKAHMEYNVITNMANLTLLILSYLLGIKLVLTGFCGYIAYYNPTRVAWCRVLLMVSWLFLGMYKTLGYLTVVFIYEIITHRDNIKGLLYGVDQFAVSLDNLPNDGPDRARLSVLVSYAKWWVDTKRKYSDICHKVSNNHICQTVLLGYYQMSMNLYKLEPILWAVGNLGDHTLKTTPGINTWYTSLTNGWNCCREGLKFFDGVGSKSGSSSSRADDTLLIDNLKAMAGEVSMQHLGEVLQAYNILNNKLEELRNKKVK